MNWKQILKEIGIILLITVLLMVLTFAYYATSGVLATIIGNAIYLPILFLFPATLIWGILKLIKRLRKKKN